MLRCEGGCGRMYDEYYRMPDWSICCVHCYKQGSYFAEMSAIMDSDMLATLEQEVIAMSQKVKADEARLKQLEMEIELEKSRYPKDWMRYERNPKDLWVPFNYDEVQMLERQRNDLEMSQRLYGYFLRPSVLPLPNNTYYYSKATLISKEESHYFETEILPREQEAIRKLMDEVEAIKREQAKRKEQEELKHSEESQPVMENEVETPAEPAVTDALDSTETYNERRKWITPVVIGGLVALLGYFAWMVLF